MYDRSSALPIIITLSVLATMASNSKQKSPLMLKDFLLLDDSPSNSFHRDPPPAKMRRSRSKSPIAALQKLLTSIKSSSSKKKKKKNSPEIFVPLTVKEILRLRSFRDLIDGLGDEVENFPQLDLLSPDQRWRFDEFVGHEIGNRNVGGKDPMEAGTGKLPCGSNDMVGPRKSERISTDEEEQCSPISVLHSPFRDEDDDSISSIDQTLANVERTTQRLMESIKWLEGLAGVDSMDSDDKEDDFLEEPNDPKTKSLCFKDTTREIEECVREMEKEMQWSSRIKEETNQLGSELGLEVLNTLLHDIVFDLVVNPQS